MNMFLYLVTATILFIAGVISLFILNEVPHWHVLLVFWGISGLCVLLIVIPFVQDARSHREWLKKSEKKSHKDTEVLVPPKGMKSLYKIIQNASSRSEIEAFVKKYRFQARWRMSVIFTVIILMLSGYFTIKLLLFFNWIEQEINILDTVFNIQNFATLESFYALLISIISLAIVTDMLNQTTKQNISLILKEQYKSTLLQKFSTTLLTLIGCLLLTSSLVALNVYKSEKKEVQSQVTEIKNHAQVLKKEQHELLEKIDFLARENAQLNQELQNKVSVISELKKERRTLSKQSSAKETKINELKTKLDDAEERLNHFQEKAILASTRYEAERLELNTQIASLEKQINLLESEKQEAEAKILALEERLNLTQGLLSASKDELFQKKSTLKEWKSRIRLKEYEWGDGFTKLVDENTLLRINTFELFQENTPTQLKLDAPVKLERIAIHLKDIIEQHEQAWVMVHTHTNALPSQTSAYESKLELTAIQAARLQQKLHDFGVLKIIAAGFGFQKELDTRLNQEALERNNRIEIFIVRLPL